jgi:hypothetical protein
MIIKRFRKELPLCLAVGLLFLVLNADTSLARAGGSSRADVLLGPCGSATAQGPTSFDDDFTNLSINGRTAVTPGAVTVSPGTITFKNTVQNFGPNDDAFIISAPSIPSGFNVEISSDFGDHYASLDSSRNVTVPVAYRASVTFLVRVTAPAGLQTLNAFDTVIRATSTTDPAVTNETIDRLYTGFVQLELKAKPVDGSGVSDVGSAPPGTELEFIITYTNISAARGTGSALLTAFNVVIKADGNAAPNNWGATTEHIVGASDNQGGNIVGDREGSTCLTDQVMALEAGKSGVFKFRRRIR